MPESEEAVDRARFGRFHRTMDDVFKEHTFATLDPFHSERDYVRCTQQISAMLTFLHSINTDWTYRNTLWLITPRQSHLEFFFFLEFLNSNGQISS